MKATLAELSRYYKSPYWNRVRGRLLYERGGRCQRCGSTRRLEAHHRTYAHLYSELSHMGDLELLCGGPGSCHEAQTLRDRRARAKARPRRKGTVRRLRDALGKFL